MTPERWQQVKSVFHKAVELAPDECSGFLDQACSTDHSLRCEVESLLSSDGEARSSFLELDSTRVTLLGGTKLGDYEVQSLLGSGGMGLVYRARDERFGRDVAIKVLPPFFASDRERLRRFEQEARAAAALNHPNILAVHQLGTYEGSTYLVLQTKLKQNVQQPFRGVHALNFQVSYTLSRFENSGGSGVPNALNSDQDFGVFGLDNANPNRYFGPSVLDRTHQLSFGGYADLPRGFQMALIGHFWSPLSTTLEVPNTNLGPGEIFRTDFTGDGTVQDPLPGTRVGSFDRGIDVSNINNVIANYNNAYANQPTSFSIRERSRLFASRQKPVALLRESDEWTQSGIYDHRIQPISELEVVWHFPLVDDLL